MHTLKFHAPKLRSACAMGLGLVAFAATVETARAQSGIEEVFVTARKRDESVQSVPIAITAFSPDALEQRNVRLLEDLNVAVPGFRFGSAGGKANNEIVMRGLSKIPIGEGLSSVVTYFANVALPSNGSNISMYDIASVEVLKGPQGTLFGASTLGGAVLITPVAPTYELGGYVRGGYGSDNYRKAEGAFNLPLVENKLAVRFAGQTLRRDGLQKNLSGGPDFNDLHQNNYRVSVLWDPLENLSNTLVYDRTTAYEQGYGGYMYRVNEGPLAIFSGLFGPGFAQQVTDYYEAGKRAGIHAGFSDFAEGSITRRKLQGVSNDTVWEQGSFTLRNILGYRKTELYEKIPTGGVGPMTVFGLPFILFDASQTSDRTAFSDELQLFGSAFEDRLEWIVGGYYSLDKPAGENGGLFTAFSVGGAEAAPVTAQVRNETRAIFTQGTFDISEWTTEGLSVTLGVRYTEDESFACAGSRPQFMSNSECQGTGALGDTTDGIASGETDNQELNYTFGFDWQINPDTLVYATTRHGYRAAQVNTPIFETEFTNGTGTSCTFDGASFFQCPDLTPYQTTEPEQITDYEIGVKNDWHIGDVRGRIGIAAYMTQYEDAIQFLNVQNVGIPPQYQPPKGSVGVNAAELEIKGVEIDLTVMPTDSLTLTLAGAFTDAKIKKISAPTAAGFPPYTEDNINLPSPDFSGTFGFSWVLPVQPLKGELVLSGDYYYTDDFGGQATSEQLPGYEITNFRLNWTAIASSGLDLAVYVKNAFDEEYFAGGVVMVPGFPMSVAIAGDPRTWGIEATYKF